MKSESRLDRQKIEYRVLWCLILSGGILLRICYLARYPMGVNADEAYAGYEAYALLHGGIDSHGYHFPVYFISWGSGMNVLYSYLSMLFIKIGGLSLLTVRLAQAVMGSISLVIFYLLLKEIKDSYFAIFGMFLLAVNPWHIMMCRWGLESNLAPAVVLLAVYFFVKALQKNEKYFVPAFLMSGLALYAYAIMWAFVPLFLLSGLVYGIYYRKIKLGRYLVAGVLMLAVLALPLLLFVAINKGYLPEIKTDFFSIPKMDSMRAGEISFDNMLGKLKDLIYFLATQVDRDSFNTSNVGIYHFCSIPFLLIGAIASVSAFVKNWRSRKYEGSDIVVLWFMAAFLTGCVISYVNVNKINCIHMPMIYFTACGGMICIRKIHQRLIYLVVPVYLASLAIFGTWYFNESKIDFYYGYEEAMDYAASITEGDIGTVMISYSNVLMHGNVLPEEYIEKLGDMKNYAMADAFGRYIIEPRPEDMNTDTVYVLPKGLQKSYLSEGYEVSFDNGYYIVIESNR